MICTRGCNYSFMYCWWWARWTPETCTVIWHVWRSLLPRQYDLYQRLQLQFYVLLMTGTMDARNMWSNLAVNKYLQTVASCWISSTINPVAVLHCHLWPLWIYHIFTHYLIRHDFQKDTIKHKICFDFPRNFRLKCLRILTVIQWNINVYYIECRSASSF